MITLTLTFPTLDDTLDAVTKLAGIPTTISFDGSALGEPVEVSKPKKETPTAKAKAATEAAFEKPAKGKKKKIIDVDTVKAHIQSFVDMTDPDQKQAVKDYIASFGVANLSGMSPEQLQAAYDGAEDYFAAEGEGDSEDEEDPMA